MQLLKFLSSEFCLESANCKDDRDDGERGKLQKKRREREVRAEGEGERKERILMVGFKSWHSDTTRRTRERERLKALQYLFLL